MSIIPQGGNENNQECESRISKFFRLTRSVTCFASAEQVRKKACNRSDIPLSDVPDVFRPINVYADYN